MESNGVSRMEIIRRNRGLSVRNVADLLDYSQNWLWWVERKCSDSEKVSKRLRKALENFYGEKFDKLIERVKIDSTASTIG